MSEFCILAETIFWQAPFIEFPEDAFLGHFVPKADDVIPIQVAIIYSNS